MKYFLYARKSTEDEERQVMSIEAQLEELKQFAVKEKLTIAETFIESRSAKSPGREIFNKMIEKVKGSPEPVGLLAWHPDRLARNSVDGGLIVYLIDIGKITALKFPTFWFEPTPQGLFMLQVAFGQSKYYSDNLSENIRRGFRQKLRRGEWAGLAPIGYVNNTKTRNIEPDIVKAKVIVRAFEEYSKGTHHLNSLSHFLAEHGVAQKSGKPLVKASVKRILTNRAYIGFTKHNGEWFNGSFAPILSPKLFEAVQKIELANSRPRKRKLKHDFPFTNLFRCGECGSMFTAQWATGKCGGRYRYYRCTKKKGSCSQGYLREETLAEQIKEQLQTISLCEAYADYMLEKIEVLQHEEDSASHSIAEKLSMDIKASEARLDKLVESYLDGDIPKELYLKKKDENMRATLTLKEKRKAFRQQGKYWVEPLREWILDTKQAAFLSSSSDLYQIKSFVQKIGTNPLVRDKSAHFAAPVPSQFVAKRRALLPTPAPSARASSHLSDSEVSFCGDGEI